MPPHAIADLKEGESVSDGIKRQRKDALEVARQRGLPKDAKIALHIDSDAAAADVVIYIEDGESAWKRKRVWITDQYGERRQAWRVVRPVWDQMMRDIRARLFGLAVVYNSDRLARELYDTEDIIETAQYFGRHGTQRPASSTSAPRTAGAWPASWQSCTSARRPTLLAGSPAPTARWPKLANQSAGHGRSAGSKTAGP
jgi:hypothetical protein